MRRARAARVAKAVVVVAAMVFNALAPSTASGGALGDLLEHLLDPVEDAVEGTTGALGMPLRLPLDESVRGVIDGITNLSIEQQLELEIPGTVVDLVNDPVGTISGLHLLEPLDGVIEDVVHPAVLEPAADVMGPIVGAAEPATEPLGPVVDTIEGSAYGIATGALRAASLDPAAYVVRTTYRPPSGPEIVTTSDAIIDVPRDVDVDNSGLPDITVELRFLTARPSLRISRLPTATTLLPVAVESVIAPAGWDSPSRVALGVDARDTDLPEVFSAMLVDDGQASGTLAAELHTVSPRDHLTVTAAAFDEGPNQSVVDPQRLRATFTPMPADVTLAATAPGADVLSSGQVAVTVSEPAVLDATFESTHGADSTEVGVLIDRIPGSIALGVSQTGDAVAVTYSASGPVDRIVLHESDTTGGITRSVALGVEGIAATSATISIAPADGLFGIEASAPIEALTLEIVDPTGVVGRATKLALRIEGVPEDLTGSLGNDGSFGLDAGGGSIDLLELQLTSGPDVALPESTDGLLLRDTPAEFVVFVRLTGLRAVTITSAPGLGADLHTLGGRPFTVDVVTDDGAAATTALLTIDALPADLGISVADDAGAADVTYTASSTVALLGALLSRQPAGGTPLTISLAVHDLPTAFTARLSDSALEWNAAAVVPLLEAEITDPGGLGDRVNRIRVRIEDLPQSLTAAVTGGGFSIDAAAPIGLLELLATDGPDIGLADGVEGLLLRDLPSGFAAFVRLSNLQSAAITPAPLTLELHTVGTRPITVDAQQADTSGAGLDFYATVNDLPEDVTVGFTADSAGTHLTWSASAVVASLIAQLTSHQAGGGALTAALNITDLPQLVDAALSPTAGLVWHASAGVPVLLLDVDDPAGLVGNATHLTLRIDGLPQDLVAGLDGGVVAFTAGAGQTVGLLQAQLSGGATPVELIADGVFVSDTPAGFAAALRITGLRSLTFDPLTGALALGTLGGQLFTLSVEQVTAGGDSFAVDALLDVLPADVAVVLGGGSGGGLSLHYTASDVMDLLSADLVQQTAGADPVTASLRIYSLPTALDLSLDDAGQVVYTASAVVPRLELDAVNPGGFLGRATTLRVRIDGLPTALTAVVADDGTLSVEAPNEPVGLIEALFTDGDEIGLDGSDDGVVVIDTVDQFSVYVRITGLRLIALAPTTGGTELTLHTTAAKLFQAVLDQENVDDGTATAINATLDRLPAEVELGLAEDETGRTITYAASDRMDRLAADVTLTSPDGTTTFALEVLDLPTQLTLGLQTDGAITYTASDRAGSLAVVAEDPAGIFAGATLLQATLVDLPTALSILLGEDGTLTLTAPGRLGLLEALATSGPMDGLADGVDGIRLVDKPGEFVAFLRIHDLVQVGLTPNPIALTVGATSGNDFIVDAELEAGGYLGTTDGALDVGAFIDGLPSLVTLGFALEGESQVIDITSTSTIDQMTFDLLQQPAVGTPLDVGLIIDDVPTTLSLAVDITGAVAYEASAIVPLVALDAFDPAGLFDRATQLKLRLEDLPLLLDVALSETGTVDIDGHGGRLGLMEAQATTGPDDRVTTGFDGVLLEDLTDRFVVFARFTNLYRGSVTQVPLPKVDLLTDGGVPLSIGLFTSEPGKPGRRPGQAYTTATLQTMPPQVKLELLPGDPGQINVNYTASTTATSLAFETNSGNRWVTEATIANPVPKSFVACQASDNHCGGSGRTPTNIGSFGFVADQPTTLNIFDCALPLTTACNSSSTATQYTKVTNMRVKTLYFDGHAQNCCLLNQQTQGHMFISTLPPGASPSSINNADVMSGSITNKDSSKTLTMTFGTNFRAVNRLSVFTRFPSLPFSSQSITKTGLISCTTGTSLSVQVTLLGFIPITINANTLLC